MISERLGKRITVEVRHAREKLQDEDILHISLDSTSVFRDFLVVHENRFFPAI